jgi:hypothetical protein
MNDEKPADFDWVTERHNCSIHKMFQRLYQHAERNVAVLNALPESSSSEGKFDVEGGGSRFSVFVAGPRMDAVKFNLKGQEITVEGHGVNVNFKATLTLTNSGDCRLKVNGSELTEWQVLRLALEELFFGR